MTPQALRLAIALACVAAAGCATQPTTESTFKPATNTSGAESTEQMRARIHTELAGGYYELGNMGVALEEVKEALRADPNYGPAHNVAGLVYARLKEDRLAEENFQRALRINPLDSDANNNYGLFLCQSGREDAGIRYLLEAVRNPLYQNPERSYVNAGVCARRRGDVANAQDYFQQALSARPNQPQALYEMADLAYTRGNYGEARDFLNRLTQVAQPGAEMLWLGVRVARRLGDRNAEASYALQLSRNFPQSKEARALGAGQFE